MLISCSLAVFPTSHHIVVGKFIHANYFMQPPHFVAEVGYKKHHSMMYMPMKHMTCNMCCKYSILYEINYMLCEMFDEGR